MRRLALLVALGLLPLLPLDAHAIRAACAPDGFPTTPGPGVVGRLFQDGSALFHGSVWRVSCDIDDPSDVAIFFRVTPLPDPSGTIGSPYICSERFTIFQDLGEDQQIVPALLPTVEATTSFCSGLQVPRTFALERASGGSFDPTGAFILQYEDQPLSVPAGTAQHPPRIFVISTGCNPCSAGQVAAFHIEVENTGAPVGVELKTGLRFPDGRLVSLLGNPCGGDPRLRRVRHPAGRDRRPGRGAEWNLHRGGRDPGADPGDDAQPAQRPGREAVSPTLASSPAKRWRILSRESVRKSGALTARIFTLLPSPRWRPLHVLKADLDPGLEGKGDLGQRPELEVRYPEEAGDVLRWRSQVTPGAPWSSRGAAGPRFGPDPAARERLG